MLEGRQLALRLREVCEATNTADFKVAAAIRLIDGPLGFDLGDLFAQVKFNARKFHDEIVQLPFVPGSLLEAWRQNPEAGLPDATSDDAPEGASGEGSGLLLCLGENELDTLPMPDCVVEGLIVAGRPNLFTGQHNTGKSALALDFCLSISRGLPWNGRATKRGATFYLAAEGASGLKKRVKAWKQHHGVGHAPDFRTIPVAVAFDKAPALDRLIRTLCHYTRPENPAALVVIDTLSMCSGEADENSQSDMKRFVQAAEQICLATGAAVLIIHHNNRSGTYRGSSALPANCDGFFSLEGNSGDAAVRLQPHKIKDFGPGETINLQREVVTLENMFNAQGKPETSVVFLGTEASKAGVQLSGQDLATLRALLALVAVPDVAVAEGGATATGNKENPMVGATAGVTSTVWLERAGKDGVSKASFDRAKKKLLECGAVRRDKPGKVGALFVPQQSWLEENGFKEVSP